MTKIDKTKVPPALHSLIPVAERWGINDDYEREQLLSEASEEELRALVSSIDDISDEDLYGWLEGPESYLDMPSEEYAIFTCLTMAIDSAKIKLKRLNSCGAQETNPRDSGGSTGTEIGDSGGEDE